MKTENIINTFKTIKEVEEYRNMVNEMCDKRSEFISLCNEANNLGEKSFTYIKECFESLSPELFKTNEGKKLINRYTKLVKENKNLSALHRINENIRKASKDTDIDYFMTNITNINWGVNPKTVCEDTKKLGRLLSEAYLIVGSEAKNMLPSENIALSKAINFIAEGKCNSKNISDYSDASKIIKEHIKLNNSSKNIFETVNLDEMAEKLINEFNSKYSDKLTDDEIKILKEISNSSDKESVFNTYKETCTNKIKEAKITFEQNGDKSSCERLNVVLEQISNKKYNYNTVGSDICSLIELTNIFE